MNGDDIPTPMPLSPTPNVAVKNSSSSQGLSLYFLFEYWRDAVPDRVARTVEDFERRVKQMDELTGHKPADQLTKADFIAFRDSILAKGNTTATAEKDLSFLKAIMGYAHESDKIPNNPAAGIKVKKAKVSKSGLRELELADLVKLFSSPIYTENKRPQGGGGGAAAWLPLLGLYSGACLEDLCQLRPDDVQDRGGMHFLRIRDYEDETSGISTHVKTEESRRNLPVHAELIRAGFLTYVEYVRSQGEVWLFLRLSVDRFGNRGGNWSKWWARWRNRLGVSGRQKCFHAFRHNFKSACREAGIEEEGHDALTGHSGNGNIGRDYGKFSLRALTAVMMKVTHDGFKFNWVWQPSEAIWLPYKRKLVPGAKVARKATRTTS